MKLGSTTTRVRDFVNRGAEFDNLYLYPPILQACCRVIEQPFKLSTMHARTLRPQTPAQRLHVNFAGDAKGWPMVGFILMIDEFTPKNGATCFIPGSQGMEAAPSTSSLVRACGPAGSVIVFNGSVWHGHGPNENQRASTLHPGRLHPPHRKLRRKPVCPNARGDIRSYRSASEIPAQRNTRKRRRWGRNEHWTD